MEEDIKKKSHGGKREGAGRKFKLSAPTTVMRVPVVQAKDVKVMLDIIDAHTNDRPYKYSNKDVVQTIGNLQTIISNFKERVRNGKLENLEDIPNYYLMEGW